MPALSTALCQVPAAPERLLAEWRAASAERFAALSLDPRLPLPVQQALAHRARQAGIPCLETTRPLVVVHGQRPASAASLERDERAAAGRQVREALYAACAVGARRLVLPPTALSLATSRGALGQRFAEGRELELAPLREERAVRAPAALDALALTLYPLLREAELTGVALALPWPAAWPHQLPDADEVAELCRRFAGAPVVALWCSDWAQVAMALARADADWDEEQAAEEAAVARPRDEALVRETRALRLADACGLRTRLPPGCGGIDWPAARAPFIAPAGDARGAAAMRAAPELDEVVVCDGPAREVELVLGAALVSRVGG